MLRVTGYPLIFLAMFSIAGGHWAVLQSVAWAGMIIEYSKNSTLGAAMTRTFSGKSPCEMCKAIEVGKQKEDRLPASVKAEIKIEKFLVWGRQGTPHPTAKGFSYGPLSDEPAFARSTSPSKPVPITA